MPPRDLKKSVVPFTATISSVFVAAFFLNFVWESYHAVFLYENHNFSAERYVGMLTYVAAVDGFCVVGIYLFIAALWRDPLWLRAMNTKHIFIVCTSGIALAAFIEYRKVFVLSAWSYTKLMPTLFGIGISPVIQLAATGLLSLWLTKKLRHRCEPS